MALFDDQNELTETFDIVLRLIKGKDTAVLHRYNKGRPTEVHRFDGTQRNLNFLSVGHNYKILNNLAIDSV